MDEHPVVLFDGVCNYCNNMVNFVIRQDKDQFFKFAALQSTVGQELLKQYNLPTGELNSFILIKGNKVYQKSSAGLKVMNDLPWFWKWTQVFWIVPKPVRDWIYSFIANNRYKWFGKKEACMIPTPEVRSRFLI